MGNHREHLVLPSWHRLCRGSSTGRNEHIFMQQRQEQQKKNPEIKQTYRHTQCIAALLHAGHLYMDAAVVVVPDHPTIELQAQALAS